MLKQSMWAFVLLAGVTAALKMRGSDDELNPDERRLTKECRVLLVSAGTRGDAQPYVVLGQELRRRGCSVHIATNKDHASFVTKLGFEFTPFTGSVDDILRSDEGKKMIIEGDGLSFMRHVGNLTAPLQPDILRVCKELAQTVKPTIVIGHFLRRFQSTIIAEATGAKLIMGHLQPDLPSSEVPNAFMASQSFHDPVEFMDTDAVMRGAIRGIMMAKGLKEHTGSLNKMSHTMQDGSQWTSFGAQFNGLRKELGLKEQKMEDFVDAFTKKASHLFLFNNRVMGAGTDYEDQGFNVEEPGFMFLDQHEDFEPEEGLRDFLEASEEKPVYVGWGSMSLWPERQSELAFKALKLAGKRGVVLRGWAGVSSEKLKDPELKEWAKKNVYELEHGTDHLWLLPKMSAAVFHGGAGTLGAVSRAGIPMVITPFAFDQPYNAKTMIRQGASPKQFVRFIDLCPAKLKECDAEKLASLITKATTDPEIQKKAKELGDHVLSQSGAERAAEFVLEQAGAI